MHTAHTVSRVVAKSGDTRPFALYSSRNLVGTREVDSTS